jgi:3-hydroxybutyryl-CoA dehydrogenase
VTVLGVVGAGTMGAGIAQLGLQAGVPTRLLDADPAALGRARERIARHVDAGALQLVEDVAGLAGCTVVVEAVPEDLALKQRVLAEVAGAVGDACVLATNTSSIPVTQIAAGVPVPERVAGMHFFNPAPVMRLVEVVRAVRTSDAAARVVTELGEAMGKRVIVAADGPGFLVNRCNRPFGLEALRCLQEGLADVETIDRVVRLGGGFRMGPFELQDLVGIDVGLEVSRSCYELSFGEPRWRPSPLQARMAASGRLGRKTGEGWYGYRDGPHRPDDPPAPADPPRGDGLIVVAGMSRLAEELFDAAADAGWEVASPQEAAGEVPFLALDCGREPDDDTPIEGGPQALLCAAASLAALEGHGPAVGFFALAPLSVSRLVELTRGPGTSSAAAAAAERFFATLGKEVAWVGDAPGLVLGRIVCQLVNEAAFAIGEGVGDAEELDAGMVLALNHPRGPLAWGEHVGLEEIATVLGALHTETGEERYRVAPALRRAVQLGLTFHEAATLD